MFIAERQGFEPITLTALISSSVSDIDLFSTETENTFLSLWADAVDENAGMHRSVSKRGRSIFAAQVLKSGFFFIYL